MESSYKKAWIVWLGVLVLVAILVALSLVVGRENNKGKIFKIGSISALTGVGSSIGEQEMKGVSLAVSEINEAGGINGARLELVAEDVSLDKMKSAATVMEKFASIDKVSAIVGPQWDEPMAIVGPLAESSGIPVIGADTTQNVEAEVNWEYVFGAWHDNQVGIREILRFAQSKGWKNISLVRVFDGGFWKYTHDVFVREAPSYGVTITSDYDIGDIGSTDFRPTILKLKNDKPDAVFMVLGDYNQCIIFNQSRQLSFDIPWLSTEAAGNPEAISGCPNSLEGKLFFSSPTNGEKYDVFARHFEEKFGTKPLFPSAATAYDSVYVIAEALKKTKGQTGKALRDAIASTNYSGGASQEIIRFNKKGFVETPENGFVMMTARDGQYVKVETE